MMMSSPMPQAPVKLEDEDTGDTPGVAMKKPLS